MPSYCSVYGCSYSSAKNPELSFFQYPKDAKMLKAWVTRVRRENFTPTSTSYVCSRHFVESDLYIPQTDTPSVFKRRRLCKGAIPSVNLRGREEDERIQKWPSRVLGRSSSATSQPETVPPVQDLDVSMDQMPENERPDEATSAASVENFRMEELQERIASLEKMRFLYKNMTASDIRNYTGI